MLCRRFFDSSHFVRFEVFTDLIFGVLCLAQSFAFPRKNTPSLGNEGGKTPPSLRKKGVKTVGKTPLLFPSLGNEGGKTPPSLWKEGGVGQRQSTLNRFWGPSQEDYKDNRAAQEQGGPRAFQRPPSSDWLRPHAHGSLIGCARNFCSQLCMGQTSLRERVLTRCDDCPDSQTKLLPGYQLGVSSHKFQSNRFRRFLTHWEQEDTNG